MPTRRFFLQLLLGLASLWRSIVKGNGRPQFSSRKLESVTTSAMRVFTGQALSEIAFPLGGIGTGTVSLGGRGQLRDWEIFGRPGKGKTLPFTFFAIWAKRGNEKPVTRLLERKLLPPYPGGFGTPQNLLSGVARLDEATFRGEYPFAWIDFEDRTLPLKVSLEGWNPFIPLNDRDSSIPVAIFRWTLKNPSEQPVAASVAATLFNPIGTDGKNFGNELFGQNLNEYVEEPELRGLRLSSQKVPPESAYFGTMALATTWKDLDVQTRWYRGGWWDHAHLFWDDFADDGRVQSITDAEPSPPNRSDIGALVLHATVPAQGEVTLPVFLTWHFPNRENYWNSEPEVKGKVMRNFVATQFKDAWDAAGYTVRQLERLEKETRLWHEALFGSTLPDYVLDAVSSQASIIRTNTCLRLDDGSFFAFEGCGDEGGCCWMNCTHVWNYEQALAHLFPNLERRMRETDFLHNTREDGSMAFRSLIPLGPYLWKFKPAADGQMGTVMKAYREWKLSGDTEWLRKIWPGVQRALEFAWAKERGWDPNQDGVMEGEQHNTYDIEFYGPNTMMGSLYLGALRAAEEMAKALGQENTAGHYRALFEKGRARLERELWKGEYYIQKVEVLPGIDLPEHLRSPENPAWPKYQYGEGCLSDQLLGQWFAHVVGLGYLLEPERVKKAVHSIFKNNWRKPIGEFSNVQRVYALNDEAGLLLCSWPKGNRPALPFVYSDEVWTGIEYQVAAHLIYEGFVDEGLAIVRGVRDRYDGTRRNPWDEVECGHHYARAMASWSVLLALSGYEYDGVKGHLGFSPRWQSKRFQCFWSTGSGWGIFAQEAKGGKLKARVDVKYGALRLSSFSLPSRGKESATVKANQKEIEAMAEIRDGMVVLRFAEPVEVTAGGVIEVEI